jgi:hypothetical protein
LVKAHTTQNRYYYFGKMCGQAEITALYKVAVRPLIPAYLSKTVQTSVTFQGSSYFIAHTHCLHIPHIMSAAPPIVAFKKGPRRPVTSSRKRSASPSSSAAAAVSADPSSSTSIAPSSSVIRPTKKAFANPLIQGSKRRRDPNESAEDGGGLDELDYKADDAGLVKGDAFATRSTDYDLESLEKSDKRVRLNEVSSFLFTGISK